MNTIECDGCGKRVPAEQTQSLSGQQWDGHWIDLDICLPCFSGEPTEKEGV